MPNNPNIHRRHSIRLKGYDYSQPGMYFVTVCVNRMGDGRGEKFFAPTNATTIVPTMPFGEITNGKMILNEHGKFVEKYLLEIPQHFPYAILHEFVIMPNHIHVIIELTNYDATTAIGTTTVGANNYSPATVVDPSMSLVSTIGANNYSPLQHQQPPRPHGTSRTIGSIIRGFKIGVTKQIGYSVWQRNYWEHIIRDEQSYRCIVDYIINNPVKWENDKFYTK